MLPKGCEMLEEALIRRFEAAGREWTDGAIVSIEQRWDNPIVSIPEGDGWVVVDCLRARREERPYYGHFDIISRPWAKKLGEMRREVEGIAMGETGGEVEGRWISGGEIEKSLNRLMVYPEVGIRGGSVWLYGVSHDMVGKVRGEMERMGCLSQGGMMSSSLRVTRGWDLEFRMPKVRQEDMLPFPGGEGAGEVPDGYVLVRFEAYSTTVMVRQFPWTGMHAWLVAEGDAEGFIQDYGMRGKRVERREGSRLYGVNFRQADEYVCGRGDELPEVGDLHAGHAVTSFWARRCPMGCNGCGYEEDVRDWSNPYQVLVR